MLDEAFERAQADLTSIRLDSFGRRVFQHDGKVIKYGEPVELREVDALSYIRRSGLQVPVPEVYSSGSCGQVQVVEMGLIKGDTLDKVWHRLSQQEKHKYAQQLRQVVDQLRSLEGDYIGSFERGSAVDPRRDRHVGGPFDNGAAYNEFLLSNTIAKTPKILPEDARGSFVENDS